MYRHHKLALSLSLVAILHLIVVFVLPVSAIRTALIPFPLWLLVTLGAYALGSVGWGLLTFRECPEAAEDLKREIEAAKEAITKKMKAVETK